MSIVRLLVCIIICIISKLSVAQDTTSLYSKLYNLPDKFFNSINSKAQELESKLSKQTDKYLRKLERNEKRLKQKLAKKDSLSAEQIFGSVEQRYATLRAKLIDISSRTKELRSSYYPKMDSLSTTLKFLNQSDFLQSVPALGGKVKSALGNYQSLNSKLDHVKDIESFLKNRQDELKSKLAGLPVMKQFKKFQKDVYYYRAQMQEYRNLLNDPSKLEQKALELVRKIPAFQNFFSKYSELAGLFPNSQSGPNSTAVNLTGLQSRSTVQQLIQQRLASGGANAQQMVQQNLQQAQSQLSDWKNKIAKLGGGDSDIDIPDFKPNSQKTKSFFNRLELGSNLQSSKSTHFFPTTTDLGLSVGYKLNDKSIVGIGASYKLGWGKDIRHIAISHEGFGVRSFVDVKFKGSFWITGGGEMNYRSSFRNFSILNDYSSWQKSALVGISKKYQVSKKVKGNMKLMYDFLYNQQVPRTQPIVFRLGYNFK